MTTWPNFSKRGIRIRSDMVEETDIREILVGLSHPFGDLQVPLDEWMRVGPQGRPLMRPISAHDARSGKKLPLRVIPWRYRNSALYRLLVRSRLLRPTWK